MAPSPVYLENKSQFPNGIVRLVSFVSTTARSLAEHRSYCVLILRATSLSLQSGSHLLHLCALTYGGSRRSRY